MRLVQDVRMRITAIAFALLLPADLRPGRYDLAVAIVEPSTREPAIRLAVAGRAADGWYPLSRVDVATR